jgi:hypothetical protein
MYWNYNCPECARPVQVNWELLESESLCQHCGAKHYPPTPHEDHYAYVDTPEWPQEMAEAVAVLRGTVCIVPGCYHERSTLVHRQPLTKGGHTSVENLLPMCERHAASKGEREYGEWLDETRQQAAADKQAEPKIEITITSVEPRPGGSAGPAYGSASGIVVPIAAARPEGKSRPEPVAANALPALLVRAPFLRGPVTRVVLDYDWRVRSSGRCRLFLLAWPRSDQPDLAPLGSPKYAGIFAAKDHLGVAGETGANQLDLVLPEAPGGRWTAGVAMIDEGCGFELSEYVLAGMT